MGTEENTCGGRIVIRYAKKGHSMRELLWTETKISKNDIKRKVKGKVIECSSRIYLLHEA